MIIIIIIIILGSGTSDSKQPATYGNRQKLFVSKRPKYYELLIIIPLQKPYSRSVFVVVFFFITMKIVLYTPNETAGRKLGNRGEIPLDKLPPDGRRRTARDNRPATRRLNDLSCPKAVTDGLVGDWVDGLADRWMNGRLCHYIIALSRPRVCYLYIIILSY